MSSVSFDSATLNQDAERLMRKSLRRIARLVLLLVALALAGWAGPPSNVKRMVSATTEDTREPAHYDEPDAQRTGLKLAVLSVFIDENKL